MRGPWLPSAWLLLACLSLQSRADGGERERLAAERQVLTERYAAEERECSERFVVTACVDDVRLRRRAALTLVRERELELADQERRERALERQSALAARKQAAAQRPPAPSSPELRARNPAASTSVAAEPASSRAHADPQSRAAHAAERAQAASRRIDDAQAAQSEVARRQAARAAAGKKDLPLPVQAASAAGR